MRTKGKGIWKALFLKIGFLFNMENSTLRRGSYLKAPVGVFTDPAKFEKLRIICF
jgi:hypothetical protein